MVVLCNCPFTIVVVAKGLSFPYAFEEFFNMMYKQSKKGCESDMSVRYLMILKQTLTSLDSRCYEKIEIPCLN